MKTLRWATILTILAFCSALSFADSVPPPDGNIGAKSGGRSVPITSLNTSAATLAFSACPGAPMSDTAIDCALFGTPPPAEVFGGYNQTGFAWNSLSITISGLTAGEVVGCSVAGLFSITNCSGSAPTLIAPADGVVTLSFSQGTGSGIGCFDPNSSSGPDAPVPGANAACIANSLAAFTNNLNPSNPILPYWNPLGNPNALNCQIIGTPITPQPAGSVCGSDEFVIGIGVNGMPFDPGDVIVAESLSANTPEPQTILLVGGAMISMLMLGLKKARLV